MAVLPSSLNKEPERGTQQPREAGLRCNGGTRFCRNLEVVVLASGCRLPDETFDLRHISQVYTKPSATDVNAFALQRYLLVRASLYPVESGDSRPD